MVLFVIERVFMSIFFLLILLLFLCVCAMIVGFIFDIYGIIKSTPDFFKKIPFKQMFVYKKWELNVIAQGLNKFDKYYLSYEEYKGFQLIAYLKVRMKAYNKMIECEELGLFEDKAIIWKYK